MHIPTLRKPDWLSAMWPKLPGIARPPTPLANPNAVQQIIVLAAIAATVYIILSGSPSSLYAIAILAVKSALIRYKRPPLKIWWLLPALAIGVILTIVNFGGIVGRYSGFGLLIILLALKILESKDHRDYQFSVLLIYFIAAGNFLYESSIPSVLLTLAYAIAITTALANLGQSSLVNTGFNAKLSLITLIKAFPLALILFFFFPRIEANFGFLPSQDELPSALSEVLSPGEISANAFSDELAFRVEFDEVPANPEQLYWRAKVMTREENFVWYMQRFLSRPTSDIDKEEQAKISSQSQLVSYRVLHQNTSDTHLPALEYLVESDLGLAFNDNTLRLFNTPKTRFSYHATARPGESSSLQSEGNNSALFLAVSHTPNAEMQRLLDDWRATTNSPIELIQKVLMHFRTQPFAYNLIPPVLEIDPFNEFMFDTRTGYCEHYASAFTTIARWLGIPARIVTGYLGGKWNPGGQFLQVRYSDAHAWSEVWIDGSGWVRVDPTGAIAPERIEFGIDALRQLWDSGLWDSHFSASGLADVLYPGQFGRTLSNLSDFWDMAEYRWSRWVVEFDAEAQRELIRKLGFDGDRIYTTLLLIMTIGACFCLGLYLLLLLPKRRSLSKVDRLYLQFCTNLARKGVIRAPHEGPQEFGLRATAALPERSSVIEFLIQNYIQAKYADQENSVAGMKIALKHL